MSARVRTLRLLALGGYSGLLALMVIWHGWLEPPLRFHVLWVLALTAGPLLFALHGMVSGTPYTHAWVSLLALPYLTHGIVALSVETTVPAALETAFSLMLYFGAVFYVRFRSREIKAQEGRERTG